MSVTFDASGDITGALLTTGSQASTQGILLPFPTTVVAVTASATSSGAGNTLQIRETGTTRDTQNFIGVKQIFNDLSVDLAQNEFLRRYVNAGDTAVNSPIVTVYYKWRKPTA